MPITAALYREALTEREEDAQLRLDFAAFAQRCFRELNPLVPLAMNWHFEIMPAKLAAVHAGRDPAADHQRAAAPSEIAVGLGRVSGLVSRAPARHADRLRQLCAGSRRQTRRAIAGASSPATGTERIFATRLSAAAAGGGASSRRRHRAAGSPPRSAAC